MIIINSAAYVIPEFRNEFGLIPPTFLPIANKKLILFQVNSLRKQFSKERIILSLPNDFNLSLNERSLIDYLNIEIVFIQNGLSLGMALLYLLNTIEYDHKEILHLLHGDTLLDKFPLDLDCIALAKTQDDYSWEFEKNTKLPLIWCGFFFFFIYSWFHSCIS